MVWWSALSRHTEGFIIRLVTDIRLMTCHFKLKPELDVTPRQ